MEREKKRYALLRSGSHWEGVTKTGLQEEKDGALTLARVPAPANGKEVVLSRPFEVKPSGIAVGTCGDMYLAVTANNRVIWQDGICRARKITRKIVVPPIGGAVSAPGHFREPRGMLLQQDKLYVADSGNARIQILHVPTMEVCAAWEDHFHRPTALAADTLGRIYVLDRGLKKVLRFTPSGILDEAFSATIGSQGKLTSPAFLTIDTNNIIYVSDDAANQVLRFDADGNFIDPLPSPGAALYKPRALIAYKDRLFIADSASGRIWVFDLQEGQYVGTVVGYQGPVSALAVNETGTLYIKTGQYKRFYQFSADAAFVSSGQLVAGPLDAGLQSEWFRVVVRADVPENTGVQLQLLTAENETTTPGETDWITAHSIDTLVILPEQKPRYTQRFLWLRIMLTSTDSSESPRIKQIQAETAGESILSYLPAMYQEDAESRDFLRRFLALFQAEYGDLLRELEEMPRRFDPATTPEDHLGWLASWLAFDLPTNRPADDIRSLLSKVHNLYQRRGTLLGLCEFVRIYAGVQITIIETYRDRRMWQLGHASYLGLNTGLAPYNPAGFIVPEITKVSDLNIPGTSNTTITGKNAKQEALVVVGDAVVGESGPLASSDLGEPLFSDTAHHFSVLVYASKVRENQQRMVLKEVIENEKPAHTDCHVCFIEPKMRVGFQARIGVDSIIAGPPEPMTLDATILGLDSRMGIIKGKDDMSRTGQKAHLGIDMIIQ